MRISYKYGATKREEVEGNFIGWDYAHFNDYSPLFKFPGRKWTTEEILEEDVEPAIEQIWLLYRSKNKGE